LLSEVREHFSGQLLWAMPPHRAVINPPPFLDAVDQVYLTWSLEAIQDTGTDPAAAFEAWLDNSVLTFQIILGKPVILAITYPSDPSLETQLEAYTYLIQEVTERDWIGGFVSRGYYPPAALQDLSASVHGKPTSKLLEYWFPKLLGTGTP
jgi:hypothetical protein